MRYRFELGTADDDAQLRHVLAQTPMAGRISVCFRCEPSYHQAAVAHGGCRQVVVCRQQGTQQIIGFGCRSIRDRYINGVAQPIGYLSSLRVLEPHRNIGLVARGYRYFGELHAADQRTELYLTTIAKGNERAEAILTSGRAGLPTYQFAGTYHTLALHVRRRPRPRAERDLTIRQATLGDLPSVIEFLNREGPRRQFFPKYVPGDFFNADATFRDLKPSDILLAYRQEQLVGTIAKWNQLGFRQFLVMGYQPPLRWIRPMYNAWAQFRGSPQLPPAGTSLQHPTAAIPVIADDDPAVFDELLDRLLEQVAQTGSDCLLLGLHESDPLFPSARQRPFTSYETHLYLVAWQGEERLRDALDDRPPYLELGSL